MMTMVEGLKSLITADVSSRGGMDETCVWHRILMGSVNKRKKKG